MGSKGEISAMNGAPRVVLPEHVNSGQAGPAPPSYEEAMGQSLSSVKASQPELPPLAFIDIMPRCLYNGNLKAKVMPKFQSFSDIISCANQWLRGNPGLRVWKCETVERRLNPDGTMDLESMLHRHSTYGFNVFVYGLRLWLTKRLKPDDPVQQLGLMNVLPDRKEVDFPMPYSGCLVAPGNMMGMRFGSAMNFGPSIVLKQTFLTYEGLQHTVGKLNAILAPKALNGSVLNVETATLKAAMSLENQQFTPDDAAWCDHGNATPKRQLKFLRVYYVIGQPSSGEIRMMEVVPEFERMPSMATPSKFESVDNMMARAQQWIRIQSGVKFLNVETDYVNVFESGERALVDSDATDEFEKSGWGGNKVVQVLRLFYVSDPSVGSFENTFMTSKVFLPARVGERTYESMQETIHRITAWLKVTGVPLFGVETTRYLFTGSPDGAGVNTDRPDVLLPKSSGTQWLTAIRLYFPTYFNEPPPHLLPPLPDRPSEACTLL